MFKENCLCGCCCGFTFCWEKLAQIRPGKICILVEETTLKVAIKIYLLHTDHNIFTTLAAFMLVWQSDLISIKRNYLFLLHREKKVNFFAGMVLYNLYKLMVLMLVVFLLYAVFFLKKIICLVLFPASWLNQEKGWDINQ